MFLGKKIRMNRLVNKKTGRLLAITVDHAIARGVLPGLEKIEETIEKVMQGNPDSLTMQKGIAEKCFAPYAGGETGLILKATSFSPYQEAYDTPTADVEEAVRLGADAISVGVLVGGKDQPGMITHLAKITKEAASLGMPVVSHIYPRGEYIKDTKAYENVRYAVRVAAELGVDIIKTTYPGNPDDFRKVVEACPAMVVVAGGSPGKDIRSYFQMTRDVIDNGGGGVTYGRFVWQHETPGLVVKALAALIHDNASVEEALKIVNG
jgi:DhnA family fructose-bisphosphate aldolase class Ia